MNIVRTTFKNIVRMSKTPINKGNVKSNPNLTLENENILNEILMGEGRSLKEYSRENTMTALDDILSRCSKKSEIRHEESKATSNIRFVSIDDLYASHK